MFICGCLGKMKHMRASRFYSLHSEVERFGARGFNGFQLLLFRVLYDSLIGPMVFFHRHSICMHLPVPFSAALCVVMVIFMKKIASSRLLRSGPICGRIPEQRHNNGNEHICTV